MKKAASEDQGGWWLSKTLGAHLAAEALWLSFSLMRADLPLRSRK
jgi:hypothetical protein